MPTKGLVSIGEKWTLKIHNCFIKHLGIHYIFINLSPTCLKHTQAGKQAGRHVHTQTQRERERERVEKYCKKVNQYQELSKSNSFNKFTIIMTS